MQRLSRYRVAVIAADGFEFSELAEPIRVLKDTGADVFIVSPKPGEIQGYRHFEKAEPVSVDLNLAEVGVNDFDAIMLPGGAMNADFLRMDENLRKLLSEFDDAKKPIAAICHAAWELVSAGLVPGRTLTSYHTIQDDIRNAGGHWVDKEVVLDDNWVTSRQPMDLPAFNKTMVDLFARDNKSRQEQVAG
ncbi:MAG: type 1 glutamine amidotransferase domain-containing protein [Oligoflexales bacterium]